MKQTAIVLALRLGMEDILAENETRIVTSGAICNSAPAAGGPSYTKRRMPLGFVKLRPARAS
jgi:hypothetical protein